ncbi:hypothetical protein BX070DRAFT_259171, partial [Coemansia spiralis]
GIEIGYSYLQKIGRVGIKNGRIIYFLNSYKYTTLSMQLSSSSKPGHAKVLIFYFIHLRI